MMACGVKVLEMSLTYMLKVCTIQQDNEMIIR